MTSLHVEGMTNVHFRIHEKWATTKCARRYISKSLHPNYKRSRPWQSDMRRPSFPFVHQSLNEILGFMRLQKSAFLQLPTELILFFPSRDLKASSVTLLFRTKRRSKLLFCWRNYNIIIKNCRRQHPVYMTLIIRLQTRKNPYAASHCSVLINEL